MGIYEVCLECHNFFLKNGKEDIHSGTFTIDNGTISGVDFLITGQYFAIHDSKLNDGVYQYTPEVLATLKNETFDGAIYDMSVPPTFIDMCNDITAWQTKYGGVDSVAMSPFTSESFAGYSYSKSSGGSADGTASATSWQSVFADRLRKWRRLYIV